MFGQDTTQAGSAPAGTNDVLNAAMPDPLAPSPVTPTPVGFSMPAPSTDPTAAPIATDSSAPELPTNNFVAPTPVVIDAPSVPSEPIIPTSSFPTFPDTTPAVAAPIPTSVAVSDDLAAIKQQALEHLSPLVSHLDQTPEEKFRTTMMMIQASDNKDLVKSAFEAAQAITDEKARAQALLDVINEINYFSQQQAQTQITS